MSFIIYINVSAFFLMLTAILFMNSPFCFYSFIFTKCDRVRQILYNIEGKNMERGMSMMKSSVKKIGALVAAAVMVCAIFVGCGSSKYDTSTPDGALMTQLDALKTGDFSQLEGYSKEAIEETGFTEAQLKDLMTSLFGKSTYTAQNVETVSDTEAKVTVSGKAVDMSKFIPIVSTEFLAKATEFATKNDTTNMTAEEAQKQVMALFIDAAKAKKSSIELKDVTVTVTMEKKDGKWDVSSDDDNMNSLTELLAGSTTEELVESMQGLFGGSFA